MEISLEGNESIRIGAIGGFKERQRALTTMAAQIKCSLILEVLRNSVMFDF